MRLQMPKGQKDIVAMHIYAIIDDDDAPALWPARSMGLRCRSQLCDAEVPRPE